MLIGSRLKTLMQRGSSLMPHAADFDEPEDTLSPLFSETWYQDQYPDVKQAQIPGIIHYLNHGWTEGRNPHPLFRTAWFRIQNQLSRTGPDLLIYVTAPSGTLRAPHPAIDETWFLEQYGEGEQTVLERYVGRELGYWVPPSTLLARHDLTQLIELTNS